MDLDSVPSGSKSTTEKEESDPSYKYPFIDFNCALCGLKEKCFYGKLNAGNGHFPHDVYFMRDPFEPPSKKSRKLMLFDFLVLGCTCHLCSRSVCIHKSCSIYFGNYFCVDCISRERRRFPDEVLQLDCCTRYHHIALKIVRHIEAKKIRTARDEFDSWIKRSQESYRFVKTNRTASRANLDIPTTRKAMATKAQDSHFQFDAPPIEIPNKETNV